MHVGEQRCREDQGIVFPFESKVKLSFKIEVSCVSLLNIRCQNMLHAEPQLIDLSFPSNVGHMCFLHAVRMLTYIFLHYLWT